MTGTPGGPVSGGRIQNSGLNLSAVGVVPLGQSFVLFGKVGMFLWYSEATDVTGGFAFRSEEDGADLSLGLGEHRGKRLGNREPSQSPGPREHPSTGPALRLVRF